MSVLLDDRAVDDERAGREPGFLDLPPVLERVPLRLARARRAGLESRLIGARTEADPAQHRPIGRVRAAIGERVVSLAPLGRVEVRAAVVGRGAGEDAVDDWPVDGHLAA